MRCTVCGGEINSGDRFCNKCGSIINNDNVISNNNSSNSYNNNQNSYNNSNSYNNNQNSYTNSNSYNNNQNGYTNSNSYNNNQNGFSGIAVKKSSDLIKKIAIFGGIAVLVLVLLFGFAMHSMVLTEDKAASVAKEYLEDANVGLRFDFLYTEEFDDYFKVHFMISDYETGEFDYCYVKVTTEGECSLEQE